LNEPLRLVPEIHANQGLNMEDQTDREFLEELYHGMLRPITTKEEFDAWLDKVDRGFTWQQVLKDFTDSMEFHLRVQAIIDSVVGARQDKAPNSQP
jgi:hypothetical protein